MILSPAFWNMSLLCWDIIDVQMMDIIALEDKVYSELWGSVGRGFLKQFKRHIFFRIFSLQPKRSFHLNIFVKDYDIMFEECNYKTEKFQSNFSKFSLLNFELWIQKIMIFLVLCKGKKYLVILKVIAQILNIAFIDLSLCPDYSSNHRLWGVADKIVF